MLARRDVLSDLCEIVSVDQREHAIVCTVELLHYTNDDEEATPLRATAKMTAPYHGQAYGDWWIPDVGSIALCQFPGVGPDGSPGGDLDDGLVLGFLSTVPAPPPDGIAGALGPARRVYKGAPGLAHDRHFQGDHDLLVDGNESTEVGGNAVRTVRGDEAYTIEGGEVRAVAGNADRTVSGDLTRTIEGDEDSENQGTVSRIFRKAVEWVGDVSLKLQAATNLLLHGEAKVEITSATLVKLDAATIQALADTVVELGDVAGRVLIDDRFIALYNAHYHEGNSADTPKNGLLVAGLHTTVKTKAT